MCNWHMPVCVKCSVNMRCEKNGVEVLDIASFGPYKIWAADKYKCPKCGNEVVVGFAREGIEHFEEGFQELVENARNHTQVIEVR